MQAIETEKDLLLGDGSSDEEKVPNPIPVRKSSRKRKAPSDSSFTGGDGLTDFNDSYEDSESEDEYDKKKRTKVSTKATKMGKFSISKAKLCKKIFLISNESFMKFAYKNLLINFCVYYYQRCHLITSNQKI